MKRSPRLIWCVSIVIVGLVATISSCGTADRGREVAAEDNTVPVARPVEKNVKLDEPGEPLESEEIEGQGSGYLLRIKPVDDPISYHIKRQDRTLTTFQPEYTTNIDLEFDVTVTCGAGNNFYYSVKKVVGVDLDKTETRHLKNIAKTIEKERWVRKFDSFGPTSELEFVDYNPAGWAGMMAARALGRYEFSFMDMHFPKGKRDIGGVWHSPSDVAKETKYNLAPGDSDEPIYENSEVRETGDLAEYKLVKVDRQGGLLIGEIAYRALGDVEMKFDSHVIGNEKTNEHISVEGTIWLDLATGWPVKAKFVRRVEVTASGGLIVDEYTIVAERL